MRSYVWFLKHFSVPVEIILLAAATIYGLKLVFLYQPLGQTEYHTTLMLIVLALGLLIQYFLHNLGHMVFGVLFGGKVLAYRLLGTAYVREGKTFHCREEIPETTLCPVITAPRGRSDLCSGMNFYGGALMDLFTALLSLILLRLFADSAGTLFNSLFLMLYLTGIWFFIWSGIPLVHTGEPNDALKTVYLHHDSLSRDSWKKTLWQLTQYSRADTKEKRLDLKLLSPAQMRLSADQEDRPMSYFRADLLLRCYEIFLWQARKEAASKVLAELYVHREDLPENWQKIICEEAVFLLSFSRQPREHEVSDLLMSRQVKQLIRHDTDSISSRCVYFWSLHQDRDDMKWNEYEQQAAESVSAVAFSYARHAWRGIIVNGIMTS